MKFLPLLGPLFLAGLLTFSPGCAKKDDTGKPTVAFVTNQVASFWNIAEKGANDAAADPKINVNVVVRMPSQATPEDQKRVVQELLARGDIKGIAISPLKPEVQGDLLDDIAARTNGNLITHDSDAPDSKRLCYVGMDNYDAGRMCGQLVKKALPDGGEVMLFIGRLGQANARLRRQGVIDEILGRKHNPKNDDPIEGVLKGNGYTILGTEQDGGDNDKARAKAQEAITNHKKLACMVGLFAYNPPILLDEVRRADKLKKIKIVGFDEDDATLKGIVDGELVGTVVQDPYRYGYESVRILASLVRGDRSVLPKDGVFVIPARSIEPANVQEFWAELKQKLGK
ncbi:MAG: substrate-binding domain-containing protein [Gemmataceae bacterium]|nr:substrate-binding domain-containing protein [Gemmataceae bacterium]